MFVKQNLIFLLEKRICIATNISFLFGHHVCISIIFITPYYIIFGVSNKTLMQQI